MVVATNNGKQIKGRSVSQTSKRPNRPTKGKDESDSDEPKNPRVDPCFDSVVSGPSSSVGQRVDQIETQERDFSAQRWGEPPGAHRRPTSVASRGERTDQCLEHPSDREVPLNAAQENSITAFLANMEKSLLAQMGQQTEQIRVNVETSVAKFSLQLEQTNTKLAAANTRIHELEQANKRFEERLAALEAARAESAFRHAEAVPPEQPKSKKGFDRPANPCVLKINSDKRTLVSVKEVDDLISRLAQDEGWESSIFETRGKEVDNFFTCEFISPSLGPSQAARILEKCFDKATGKWRIMQVKSPDGENVRVYVGADEAPRDAKIRTSSKRLARDIEETLDVSQEHKVFFRARDKVVMVDGLKTARVSYELSNNVLSDTLQIMWNSESVDSLKLDKVAITAAFLARENTKWVS